MYRVPDIPVTCVYCDEADDPCACDRRSRFVYRTIWTVFVGVVLYRLMFSLLF